MSVSSTPASETAGTISLWPTRSDVLVEPTNNELPATQQSIQKIIELVDALMDQCKDSLQSEFVFKEQMIIPHDSRFGQTVIERFEFLNENNHFTEEHRSRLQAVVDAESTLLTIGVYPEEGPAEQFSVYRCDNGELQVEKIKTTFIENAHEERESYLETVTIEGENGVLELQSLLENLLEASNE